MQQQQGGPPQQFGLHPPEMPPFSPAGSAGQQRISMAETPSPISSRPPALGQQHLNNELPGAGAAAVGFDEEALAAAAAGEEGAAGGSGGNRWPRQETLALLKIRSDMDAAFRDATLKGPLWEDVSRKLAEEGYRRNAKKCKEKFENVHKYYKRTKDSRAGRNDGKTYRFFQQLEALHGPAGAASPVASPAPVVGVPGVVGPSAVRPLAEPPPVGATAGMATPVLGGNLSFSTSNTEDYSDEEDSDDEGTDDMGERGKRKRTTSDGGAAVGAGSGKMMRFFEGLMKQVMERQETMQQRFLEAIEKREQDRMIREEAWRRQEMARLAREQEVLAQERTMAATRDAAVLSFIQKITGQTISMPSIAAPAITFMPPPPPSSQTHATPIAYSAGPPPSSLPPASTHSQPQPSPRLHKPSTKPPAAPLPQKSPAPATPQQQALVVAHQSSPDIVMTPVETPHDASGYDGSGGGGGAASSSRWPKAEVHALIQLRSDLDIRYQEAGPKGPLWEEISAGMQRMGYSRSSKRCKEKWENINKYFKKVKESNKKRPEDSKTCPYFHQLDALYRNKAALGSPSGAGGATVLPLPAAEHANVAPQDRIEAFTVAAPISQTAPQPHTLPSVDRNGIITNNDGNGHGGGGVSGGTQMQASNGGSVAGNRFVFSVAGGGATAKKQEDIMKETTMTPQPQPQVVQQATINSYSRTGGGGSADSDNMEEDDEDEDDYDDEEDDEDLDGNKMQYEMFQRQQQHQHQQQHHNVRQNAGATNGGGNPPGAAPSSAAATTTAGSFLGMVQ